MISAGIDYEDKVLACVLRMCVCDAPARAMVKSVKQFSGYYGCVKCEQKGTYIGRVTYPECTAQLRTDNSFCSRSNSAHHMGNSPFLELPVDMANFFPVDYMHQTCLGVMKRLILCWTSGPTSVKMSALQKVEASKRLVTFRNVITSDFARRPRPLNEIAYWKATEFRFFLVYAGYFILRRNISGVIFDHFMCLNAAISILLSDTLSTDVDYLKFAHELLVYFVSKSRDIYGSEFLVYNVHSLVHLTQEVDRFGKLDNTGAFVFENYMRTLKRFVRSARNPLAQVAKRIKEHGAFRSLSDPVVSNKLTLSSYCCHSPNNYCILEDGRCCEVVSIDAEQVSCIIAWSIHMMNLYMYAHAIQGYLAFIKFISDQGK